MREKKNNFKKDTPYSKQSIQWLEYLIELPGYNICHAENSVHGEKRIGNFRVDSFCEETNTIYEYYGCYHHGHDCNDKHDSTKWEKALEREEELLSLGYNLETITSC